MPEPAARLDRAVRDLAGRMAVVLGDVGPDDETVRFLGGLAEGADPVGPLLDLPRPGDLHPVDRLIRRLAPSDLEVGLLVLAGMAHQHEGLAAVLRTLHPLGQPDATVGLAGLLAGAGALGDGPVGRDDLRRVAVAGVLPRAGLLVVDGSGPLDERSLRVVDGLWEVLLDLPSWPPGVHAGAAAGSRQRPGRLVRDPGRPRARRRPGARRRRGPRRHRRPSRSRRRAPRRRRDRVGRRSRASSRWRSTHRPRRGRPCSPRSLAAGIPCWSSTERLLTSTSRSSRGP